MPEDIELSKAYKGKAVLVTGGAGFIGSHLVDSLVEAGAKVRVLDDLSTGNRGNLTPVLDRVDLIIGDIRDADLCLRAVEDIDIIFHQAAFVSVPESLKKPDRTFAINLFGTSHIFEAAQQHGAKRVVYASSCAVYGDCSTMPLNEPHVGRLLSPYAVSKRSMEALAEYAFACQGITSVGLRYFNVYGARQSLKSAYAAVIPIFIGACLSGQPPTVLGDGSQTRDFVHVSDVVRANMLAGIAPDIEVAVANVGTGVATSIQTLAEELCRLTKSSTAPLNGEARAGDIPRSVCDPRQAERILGFRAKIALSDGLAELIGT
jgi:nucleoside-diphosphate-sugar epimerase